LAVCQSRDSEYLNLDLPVSSSGLVADGCCSRTSLVYILSVQLHHRTGYMPLINSRICNLLTLLGNWECSSCFASRLHDIRSCASALSTFEFEQHPISSAVVNVLHNFSLDMTDFIFVVVLQQNCGDFKYGVSRSM
jgi:hypothetical protein